MALSGFQMSKSASARPPVAASGGRMNVDWPPHVSSGPLPFAGLTPVQGLPIRSHGPVTARAR